MAKASTAQAVSPCRYSSPFFMRQRDRVLTRNWQGLGGLLISKVDGDYNNVVGFPAASFFKWLGVLLEEKVDFLAV